MDEGESVNEEDVFNKRIEFRYSSQSLGLCDVNLDMLKRCIRKEIKTFCGVFQCLTDQLRIIPREVSL